MRALVTGGTGFIGASLVRRLLGDGHEVHCAVRAESRRWRLQGVETDVRLHQTDIADGDSVARLFDATRPEWVFHLAAHGAYSFETDQVAMARTNVLAAAQLVAAASRAGCAALVLAGSSAEYGARHTAPSESEPAVPNTPYGVTKAAATAMARIASAEATTCPAVVLRLYSVYGPWEDPRRLMPTLLVHALDGRWPPLAAADTTRDFVYTDDAVDAFLLAADRAAEHRGAVYNVGSGTGTTLGQLVEVARERFGVSGRPVFGAHPGRAWDARMWWVSDPRRIADELGWTATTSIGDGMAAFADWLRAHRDLYASSLGGPSPIGAGR